MYFEWQYIRTHTKEKPSKISNITLAILPFLLNNNLELVNLKCATYAQPIILSLNHLNTKLSEVGEPFIMGYNADSDIWAMNIWKKNFFFFLKSGQSPCNRF